MHLGLAIAPTLKEILEDDLSRNENHVKNRPFSQFNQFPPSLGNRSHFPVHPDPVEFQHSPTVIKASQKACNQIAKVNENDIKPITIEATLID